MNKLLDACVLSLLVCLPSGCAPESGGDEMPGEAEGGLITINSLIPNSLIPNSLIPNSLIPNSLIPNSLTSDALAPAANAALEDSGPAGDAARQFLRYTVGCALSDEQSFAFTWTDAAGAVHDEEYPGALGIAPGWATGPLLDETAQRLVSGCLAARVNWYGVSVVISMRSGSAPLKVPLTSPELVDFPHIEGAFWGNIFTASPHIHACYNSGNVAIARAAFRDCAVGHIEDPAQTGAPLPCGVIVLTGPCGASCQAFDQQGQYYPACTDWPGVSGSQRTAAVITTALP